MRRQCAQLLQRVQGRPWKNHDLPAKRKREPDDIPPDPPDDEDHFQKRDERAATLAKELSKACSALLDESPSMHHAMILFVLRPRSRSHMPPSSRSDDRIPSSGPSSESEASSLFGSRKPHRTTSGGSTPRPSSSTERAALCRFRAARFQRGFRSSVLRWGSTLDQPRHCRPPQGRLQRVDSHLPGFD